MKLFIYKRNTEYLQLKTVMEGINPTTTSFTKSSKDIRQTVMNARVLEERAETVESLQVGDIVLVETVDFPLAIAFIRNIVVQRSLKAAELTLAIGSDGLVEPVRVLTSATQPDILNTLINDYKLLHAPVPIVFTAPVLSGYVLQKDKVLPFGQCIRQLQKQGVREYINIDNSNPSQPKITINYTVEPKSYEFVLEDLINYTVTIAPDTYNKYIVFNEDDPSQYLVSYLYSDGSVGSDKLQHGFKEAVLTGSEVVEVDKFTQEECDNLLREQSYANSVELTLLLDEFIQRYTLEPFIFNSLGTKIDLILKNQSRIMTNISEVSIRGRVVTLILGVAASRFTDKIKEASSNG